MSKLSNIIRLVKRDLSITAFVNSNRNGRFMTKIMGNIKSKKKWQSDLAIPIVASDSASGGSDGKKIVNVKRIAVLNKMFMRYITELMATGTKSSEFIGRGIEINKVKVAPDFRGVNVYWIAKGTERDDEIESLLSKNAGLLRHELSQLKVMGIVPKINFIKDKEYAKLMEVDLRLAKADFGEDYVPVEPSYKFKSTATLDVTLPTHIKERLETLEDEDEVYQEPLPPMRHDVLNLNHSDIMNNIRKSMKKSQALHRKNTDAVANPAPTTINTDPIEYHSQRQQKEAFTRFLLQRQILQEKAKREQDKFNPEIEYLRSEREEILSDTPFTNGFSELDDYIEDMEDEKKI